MAAGAAQHAPRARIAPVGTGRAVADGRGAVGSQGPCVYRARLRARYPEPGAGRGSGVSNAQRGAGESATLLLPSARGCHTRKPLILLGFAMMRRRLITGGSRFETWRAHQITASVRRSVVKLTSQRSS